MTSPALVEGVNLDTVVCVLLQDLLGVFIRVEGVHEDQGNVCVVRFVQVLQDDGRQRHRRSMPKGQLESRRSSVSQ